VLVELREIGHPDLGDVLAPWLDAHGAPQA
jgi:hypothetical protein